MEDLKNMPCDDNGDCDKVHMKTLMDCVNSLTKVGFSTQFQITEGGLESLSTHHVYQCDEIQITNFYRFEGESNPSDNSILYVIKTNKGEKGLVTNAYGMYANTELDEFIQSVTDFEKRAKGNA